MSLPYADNRRDGRREVITAMARRLGRREAAGRHRRASADGPYIGDIDQGKMSLMRARQASAATAQRQRAICLRLAVMSSSRRSLNRPLSGMSTRRRPWPARHGYRLPENTTGLHNGLDRRRDI